MKREIAGISTPLMGDYNHVVIGEGKLKNNY